MGFRSGAYAKVWSIRPISDTMASINISTSKKNKQTEKLEKDFSGFATCIGTAAVKKAMALKEGDTIIIGDCEVSMTYGEDNKPTYTNYKVYSFEVADNKSKQGGAPSANSHKKADEGIDHNPVEESHLPF